MQDIILEYVFKEETSAENLKKIVWFIRILEDDEIYELHLKRPFIDNQINEEIQKIKMYSVRTNKYTRGIIWK